MLVIARKKGDATRVGDLRVVVLGVTTTHVELDVGGERKLLRLQHYLPLPGVKDGLVVLCRIKGPNQVRLGFEVPRDTRIERVP